MSLSAAEAWALAAKVALIDARHCGPLESAEKRAEASALFERAVALDSPKGLAKRLSLCLRAQAYLERAVKPAAHYAPKRKPSRRRGTKPASLPQLLHAAAHAIKEP